MPRVSFYTLGCKLNYAETGTLARDFSERAFDVVPFGRPTDVTVINTCTVTEEADRKCRQVIRRARRANPEACIIVTGCYAQLRPEAIAGIPGVDFVLGAQEKFDIFGLVTAFDRQEHTQVAVSCIDEVKRFGPAFAAGERTRAFLKVQDGCDYTCAFCTIPLARGRSRSQPVAATVRQARAIASEGYREIVLSGVNIGLYGEDQGTSLLALLLALDQVDGIDRYRISSIEPNLLTDALIDFVAESERFQPHFHIPLQSGDDDVLGKMRRRYKRAVYADRVDRILSQMPDACIGVDVIVGFPAETASAFENTFRFIEALPVAYLHVFTYSERPNTTAVEHADLPGVPRAERSRRNRMLRLLSEKKRRAFYQAYQGSVRPVLWEGAEKEGAMYGFTDNYIRVKQPADAVLAGQLSSVRLAALTADGAMGVEDPGFVSIL